MGKPKLNSFGIKADGKGLKKGIYDIQNPMKYVGNPAECLYRSSWEHKFMIYCDHESTIKKWGSETAQIEYYTQDAYGNIEKSIYWPDFFVVKIDPNDPEFEQQYFYEIKPHKSIYPDFITFDEDGNRIILPPGDKKSLKAFENWQYEVKEFEKNISKWKATKAWCEKRHIIFRLLDEIDLENLGILPPKNERYR